MDKREENEKFLTLIAQLLVAVVCILSLLITLIPKPEQRRVIALKNVGGQYMANGIVSINCNTIMPSDYGTTYFVLENNFDSEKHCKVSVKQIYDELIVDHFQMKYKIYADNLPKTESWLLPEQLTFDNILLKKNGRLTFFVDWWWAGDESGSIDNIFGKDGGQFWLIVAIEEM